MFNLWVLIIIVKNLLSGLGYNVFNSGIFLQRPMGVAVSRMVD